MREKIAQAKPVLKEESVEIKRFQDNGKDFLHFGFKNKFSEDMSLKATDIWAKFCDDNPSKRFIHIWDCQSMTGFDNSAKKRWMDHLDKYSGQTEKIILVSDNIIIRGAARIMSKMTKHHLNVYKSLPEMVSEEI
ncbi:MAG: hypothetical protein RLN88_08580 [Ekhidna sp.]|uniref:hypothetical protein n=1 Tax=Ekhidna sp. TaxID=2608089 RepID=UPI0032EB2BFD